MFDVTAMGEVLIDFACKEVDEKGYPTLKANPGGAPCNFLAALSAYGAKTAFIGKVGDDMFGKMLLQSLRDIHVETSGVMVDPDVFTTLAFVTFDAHGDRSFSFARKPGADTRIRTDEVNYNLVADSRAFHFGTLSLTDEPARTATKNAVAFAKEHGCIITFDPNLREPLWRNLDEAKEQIIWGLHQADLVKISDNEVEFLWQCGEKAAAEKIMKEFGAKVVFVTLGPEGCYFASQNGCGYVHGPKVTPVDTTGAGDIFGGSAVSRVLRLNKPLDLITEEELRETARFACTAASLSTQVSGGITSVQPEQAVWDAMRDMG